jgi:hypothetical protein
MSALVTPPGQPAPHQAEGGAVLEAALAEMDLAARAAGVEPDETLGVWIRSVRSAMACNIGCMERIETRLGAHVAAFAEAAKEDRVAMKKATDHCIAETLRLEATYDTMQIRADHLMTQTIESMADRFADKMRERTVIVEKRHNRWVLWRTGALIAGVLLSVLGGGVAWRAYLDRAATEMLERCATTVMQDRTTGQFYCPYGYTPPPY